LNFFPVQIAFGSFTLAAFCILHCFLVLSSVLF
jgi:hypothetical protein